MAVNTWVDYRDLSKAWDFHLVGVLVVRSGFNGVVDFLFIGNALISVRNGGMSFESGYRPFENIFFEHRLFKT